MQSQILNSLRALTIQGLSETDRAACKACLDFRLLHSGSLIQTFFLSYQFVASTNLTKDIPAHGQVFGQDDT